MIEKRRKEAKALHDTREQECCELYGEYCYPCVQPTTESPKAAPRQKQRSR